MLKQGWHKEPDGKIVWAEGWEYTETGSAPGRVQVVLIAGHHGPITCYSWNKELTPISAAAAEPFVDAVRKYNEAQINMLKERIGRHEGNTRKWEARASQGEIDGQ